MALRSLVEWILVAALIAVLAALWWQLRKGIAVFPEAFKVFGPTSRTLGGPGNFTGRCGQQLEIYRGGGNHVISVTLENMGDCEISLGLRDEIQSTTPEINVAIPPGTTVTRTGTQSTWQSGDGGTRWSTHNIVVVTCKPSEAPGAVCRYRWRVDSLGTIPHSGVDFA